MICAVLSLAACGSSSQPPEEKTTQWVKEKLADNLVPLSAAYEGIQVLSVEPCRIVVAHSVPTLSGDTVSHETEIPTYDILVRPNGEIRYSERVVSNCSPVGEDTMLIRRTAEAFRMRTTNFSPEEWTRMFQELNEKCRDSNL